jgi:hypothetical protein
LKGYISTEDIDDGNLQYRDSQEEADIDTMGSFTDIGAGGGDGSTSSDG